MGNDSSAMWSFIAAPIGLAIIFALMWWIARANDYWWRRVSCYAGERPSPPIGRKIPDILVARRVITWVRQRTDASPFGLGV